MYILTFVLLLSSTSLREWQNRVNVVPFKKDPYCYRRWPQIPRIYIEDTLFLEIVGNLIR